MDEENFLKRWSRRKLEKVRQQPAAAPAPADEHGPRAARATPASAAVAAPPQPTPTELPAVDSLQGLASDYKEFLNPQVDENLRRSALKKLFHDPHFNVMDGLDVYIDDYSKPDPIPESMLKELLARHLDFPAPPEPAQEEAQAPLADGPRRDAAPPAAEATAPNASTPATETRADVPAATGEEKS
jgi:uncharacterized protein DUF3306